MHQRGQILVWIIVGLLTITGVAGAAYYLGKSQNPVTYQTTLPTHTPSSSPSATPDETANWKTYKSDKFSISYPADWSVDASKEPVVLKSTDYVESQQGYRPDVGFIIAIYINKLQFSGSTGLKSTQNITWLGGSATLQEYTYEAYDWVLTTKHNGIDYQLVATVASDDVWNKNKDLILKVADTLGVK